MSGDPFPKSSQLARGERRYRRRVASPKQWQAIIAAKQGPCRACVPTGRNGGLVANVAHLIEFHHLLPRDMGGDDVADNIVPVHAFCHMKVTLGREPWTRTLAASLTDAEYAYLIGKLGEGALERLYGVGR